MPETTAPVAPPAAPTPAAVAPPTPALPKAAETPVAKPSVASSAPMQRARAELQKRFGDKTTPPSPAKPATEAPKPPAAAAPEPAKPPEAAKGAETPPVAEKPAEPPAGGKDKVSPWKLVETYKGKTKQLERELADARKQVTDPEATTNAIRRAEAAETRLKELESEMRFVDYTKSAEFKEKYQKPYEDAWGSALSDLKELVITDEAGNPRAASGEDLLALCNMPLNEAWKKAREMFGEAATEIMAHRREVRNLSKAQQEAIEKARKEGTEVQQRRAEQAQLAHSEITQKYQQFRDEDAKQYPFLQEKEGDDEWNSRLATSVEFVDGTIRTAVSDPRLTSAQREEAIRKHVAVRNRAIGFGMLRLENKRLKSEVAGLTKKLGEYQGAEPGGGAGRPSEGDGTGGGSGSPMERAKARLRQIAT